MKRTTTSDSTTKPVNRRALLRPNSPLATAPAMQAFLDNAPADQFSRMSVQSQLVSAGEAALLMELYKTTQQKNIELSTFESPFSFTSGFVLDDHLFAYVAEHLGEIPWIESLCVDNALLNQTTCTHLQAFLLRTDCQLADLSFNNCAFADTQVRFPYTAPTVEDFQWMSSHIVPGGDGLPQILPALKNWPKLARLLTSSLGKPFPYDVLAQLLIENQHIKALKVNADRSQSPADLFNALKHDRTGVSSLALSIVTTDTKANEDCLLMVLDCLANNETLQRLKLPGITVCTHEAQRAFVEGLQRNQSLYSLLPLPGFNMQVPAAVHCNLKRQLWFSKDFMRGAAEAFMSQMANAKDIGEKLALTMSSTPVERTYCAALMGLLCKATHDNAVKVRSAGLRAIAEDYILNDDQKHSLELLNDMVRCHMDLLPVDKAALVTYATSLGKVNFLPAGYATH